MTTTKNTKEKLKTFKNAEKSNPIIHCLNAGSVAKLVGLVGGNEFQTLTTLSAKN